MGVTGLLPCSLRGGTLFWEGAARYCCRKEGQIALMVFTDTPSRPFFGDDLDPLLGRFETPLRDSGRCAL